MLAAGQVIDAMATRLTGLPLAGTRVYTSRTWPLSEEELPAWRVQAADEDVEPVTVHPNMLQQHSLQVELRGHARDIAHLDHSLHALTAEALTAMFSTAPPADALSIIASKLQVTLRRIERAVITEGEAAIGLAVITLRVIFRTRASAPETLV